MKARSERQADQSVSPKRTSRQARSARKQQWLTEQATRRRRARLVRWGTGAAIAAVVVGILAWLVLRQFSNPTVSPDGVPGPEGGANVAQDVGTLVGQPAPAFTLSDADGRPYTVTPGQGRPLVLVSHMGIT